MQCLVIGWPVLPGSPNPSKCLLPWSHYQTTRCMSFEPYTRCHPRTSTSVPVCSPKCPQTSPLPNQIPCFRLWSTVIHSLKQNRKKDCLKGWCLCVCVFVFLPDFLYFHLGQRTHKYTTTRVWSHPCLQFHPIYTCSLLWHNIHVSTQIKQDISASITAHKGECLHQKPINQWLKKNTLWCS